ncbi:MAG: hypothetical protein HY062_11615 [Bacteroidetes bacterium]|nr:hypothetical protein [Bacteroidota bacterium]
MAKHKNNPFNNISRLKKVVVVTGIFVFLIGGILAAVFAIVNFQNYNSPYLFGFVFGAIGLLAGLFFANKVKTAIIINQKMQENYYQLTIYIATGFIGIVMLFGQQANTLLSTKEKCDNYIITDKIFRKGGYRRAELNILVINVEGVPHRVITNTNYWKTVSVGQQINACIYSSVIGFDYLTLTNEN